MSGESNVTSGAPGSPSHHKHHTHWKKFWKVARWVNPIGTAVEINTDHQKKQRQEEAAEAEAAEHESNIVVDGEEWWQDIPGFNDAILNVEDNWDGHVTYRKLMDHVYGPGIAPNEFKPHVFLVHPDAGPVVAAMLAHPGFWDDIACEFKGGKGCHDAKVYNFFKDIQRILTKADDKIDHKEDKALGIDK